MHFLNAIRNDRFGLILDIFYELFKLKRYKSREELVDEIHDTVIQDNLSYCHLKNSQGQRKKIQVRIPRLVCD